MLGHGRQHEHRDRQRQHRDRRRRQLRRQPLGGVGGPGQRQRRDAGYQSGAGQGEAKVEKNDKTYKISGTATGVDMANPMQPVNKPFEIEVSCP